MHMYWHKHIQPLKCGVSLLAVAVIDAADNGLRCLQHARKSNTHTLPLPVKVYITLNIVYVV